MKSRNMVLHGLVSTMLALIVMLPASPVAAWVDEHRVDERPTGHIAVDRPEAVWPVALSSTQGQVTPMIAAGDEHTVGLKSDGTVIAVGMVGEGQCDVGAWTDIIQVAAGGHHTAGLKPDGTVIAAGPSPGSKYDYGQGGLADWSDIVQVSAGYAHTVGLKSDGTVVAVGNNEHGQCDIGGWTDIIQVSAGYLHTVGLRSDGTAVAVGRDSDRQCDVGDWTDIVQVAAGYRHTVALRSDGNMAAAGNNDYGQCDVADWTKVTQVAAGYAHTVAVKSDGSAIAVGGSGSGRCNVAGWTDVIQVAAGGYHTVGLRLDGSVVVVGSVAKVKRYIDGWSATYSTYMGQCDVDAWTDIVQVAAGHEHTVGLKADGTVVAAGNNGDGQCDVSDWIDVIQAAAGERYTVGLKSDGTVVAVGSKDFGQRDVGGWTNIVQVTTGGTHTVGLRSDGTVVGTGGFDLDSWTDIVQVAAANHHVVGLKSDGTVVAVGRDSDRQCDVGDWTGILQVAAGYRYTVAVKSDGTVVAAGNNEYGQCDVGDWAEVTQVAAGYVHTVAVRSNGTVVAVGPKPGGRCDVGDWMDIVQVSAGMMHTAGLKSDGTVVAVGGDTELARWNLMLSVPPSQLILIVSSTSGGSVTAPGEGLIFCDARTTLDLVAEPDDGYRFVRWIGDIDAIADVNAVSTTIMMYDYYSVTAIFASLEPGNAAIRAGDWINLEYSITGWPDEDPYPQWLHLECLSVGGTTVNVLVTMHMSDGTEESNIVPANLEEGGGYALGLSGFVIHPNLTTGDSVYVAGYGVVPIEGETTGSYAGASRTVVRARPSEDWFAGKPTDYSYWDKLTGVIVETSMTFGDMTITARATETNMWEADPPRTGCFIATAAYGTPLAEEIRVLREFRDEYLLTNPAGQAFTDFYYSVSPPIAGFITDHPGLKPAVRVGLMPAVAMSTVVVNTTPEEKAAIVVLLLPVSVAMAVWATRRRGKGLEHV